MSSLHTGYRADIDGLRAIAVIAVVLFHFNTALLPGGFAGVDIFFVISGYLITTNILNSINIGSFSIVEFYRRRILRILPNLFFVVIVTLLIAHFIFQPKDYLELSYSALASVLSAANIYFTYFLDISYFAPATDNQPLLHIWSLGVEEQFYLFWPMLLLFAFRFIKNKKLVALFALVLCCASFIYAQFAIKNNPMFAYYMLPTRAGELLVGAMVAFLLSMYPLQRYRNRYLSSALSSCFALIGFVLIAYSLCFIDESKGFPGVNAMPSVLGAALIILAGSMGRAGSNPINRLLATKPLVMIGLLSYSLYLWHWPVMAFYRYSYGEIGFSSGLVLLLIMLICSWIGYRYVEKPMRRIRLDFKPILYRGVLPTTIAVGLAVFFVYLTKGFGMYWFNDEYKNAVNSVLPAPAAYSYDYVCQENVTDATFKKQSCIINQNNFGVEPKILLWGDSNASHYIGVLGSIAQKAGFSFRNVAHASCPPFMTNAADFTDDSRKDKCQTSVEIVKKYLNQYNVVILGGQWTSYYTRRGVESFVEHIEETVDTLLLNDKQVVLLGRVPRFSNIDNECKVKELKGLARGCLTVSKGWTEAVNSHLESISLSRDGVFYMDIDDIVCPKGLCDNYMDGLNLYYDPGHLSMVGSWKVGEYMVENNLVPAFFSGFRDLDRGRN